MFSKDEAKRMRQEFWTQFGQDCPRKWLLYNTKIKEIDLKFTVTTKIAQVSLDVYSPDSLIQAYYFEKIQSLHKILRNSYLPKVLLDEEYEVAPGKLVSRAYVELNKVSIHNKSTWETIHIFLYDHMSQLELFFYEFEDFIKS